MQDLLPDAIGFAHAWHSGVRDKGGQPFVGHPLRVMGRVAATWRSALQLGDPMPPFPRDHVLAAAVLHDVVEDTSVELDEIREKFGGMVAEWVDRMTRRKTETYKEYIWRVADDLTGVAQIIKIEDIGDNMDPARTGYMPELTKRYTEALEVLRTARGAVADAME